MTQNRRIFLNIIATYGRSLYTLVIGLVCGRWTLLALGEVDYGLLGVIGGLTFFISYFNAIVVGAIGRFYAISVGKRMSNPEAGIEECHRWFTTAVVIQSIWPTILLIAGYPVGIWAIKNFLTIPLNRIDDCVWVWRFVCLSSYISMISAPMNAMYTAKQYIAELTIYSFVTTTLNAIFIYYMYTHPGVWLAKVALWGSFLAIIPNLIIAIRAFYLFPECRFRWQYVHCWDSIKELSGFALWNAWGILGSYIRTSGVTIVVNKFFGARANAGVTIGNTVSSHCETLSGSMIGAFWPAISNQWGAANYDQARKLAFKACKIGTLLILIFALPMMLEVDEVLVLWLKKPPQFASAMCIFVLWEIILERLGSGHLMCVNAKGKIAKFQLIAGTGLVLSLPVSLILIYCGIGIYSITWALVLTRLLVTLSRVWLARSLVSMSTKYWFKHILFPIMFVTLICLGVGSLPKVFFSASFGRVCLTTLLVEIVLVAASWSFILDGEERSYMFEKVRAFVNKFGKVK